MKSLVFTIIALAFGWIIFAPKETLNPTYLPVALLKYKQAEIPDSLKVVDKLIIEIETDLYEDFTANNRPKK